MADEPANPEPTTPQVPRDLFLRGCALVFGLFVATIFGVGIAFGVAQNGLPWTIPIVYFLAVGSFAVMAIPRFIRRAREAARNAPSPESAAAAAGGEGVEAGTRAKADAKATDADEPDDMPTVWHAETHPGKVFSHQLERAGIAPGVQCGCAVVGAVFWNGIVGFFVYELIERFNGGAAVQWSEALFLIPFILVGLLLIGAVILAGLNWFVAQLVGRVDVELSDHPLVPGATLRIHVAQAGLFSLGRVVVFLVCSEEVTYVAGTSTSTAKKDVDQHSISDPEQNPDGGGLPLTTEFTVPADAMHSFEAPNNEINWTIRVTGRVLGLLPFSSEYSVTVSPD